MIWTYSAIFSWELGLVKKNSINGLILTRAEEFTLEDTKFWNTANFSLAIDTSKDNKTFWFLKSRSWFRDSKEWPVNKGKSQAVDGVGFGCKDFPHDGLFVRDVAPHRRQANTTRQVSDSLTWVGSKSDQIMQKIEFQVNFFTSYEVTPLALCWRIRRTTPCDQIHRISCPRQYLAEKRDSSPACLARPDLRIWIRASPAITKGWKDNVCYNHDGIRDR